MKILCVHAHFDDFEFVAAGTFEIWKRRLGEGLRAKVVVCTDGKAGHHFRSREETGKVRLQEQEASAAIGGYEFELLRLPDGTPPREACLQVTPEFLAGLWRLIRQFEPDYLFCPPVPGNPLAGIHIDHVAVAEAVRKVAYMINVPHAFSPEYPTNETRSQPCKVPVIVNVYDGYMSGSNQYDLAIDITEAFPKVCEMTFCHQSQIMEWIPWVGRHKMPRPTSYKDWCETLRQRLENQKKELNLKSDRLMEFFTVSAWGEVPSSERILSDFPNVLSSSSNLEQLSARLSRWQGG